MKKVCIVIPAYNEETRLEKTVRAYHAFFAQQKYISTHLLIVLNGCKDQTPTIAHHLQNTLSNISVLEMAKAGKGLAVKTGLLHAHHTLHGELIGFVDADCATAPQYFYDLIQNIGTNDGIIASRYMPGAVVSPARPFVKRWGSKIFFHGMIRSLFGMQYHDYQCGAKLFTAHAVTLIAAQMCVEQWAFDVELLYLCKRYNLQIKELPTTWHDQRDSKLNILRGGIPMLGDLIKLRRRYAFKSKQS